jgi:hypothetical protein
MTSYERKFAEKERKKYIAKIVLIFLPTIVAQRLMCLCHGNEMTTSREGKQSILRPMLNCIYVIAKKVFSTNFDVRFLYSSYTTCVLEVVEPTIFDIGEKIHKAIHHIQHHV